MRKCPSAACGQGRGHTQLGPDRAPRYGTPAQAAAAVPGPRTLSHAHAPARARPAFGPWVGSLQLPSQPSGVQAARGRAPVPLQRTSSSVQDPSPGPLAAERASRAPAEGPEGRGPCPGPGAAGAAHPAHRECSVGLGAAPPGWGSARGSHPGNARDRPGGDGATPQPGGKAGAPPAAPRDSEWTPEPPQTGREGRSPSCSPLGQRGDPEATPQLGGKAGAPAAAPPGQRGDPAVRCCPSAASSSSGNQHFCRRAGVLRAAPQGAGPGGQGGGWGDCGVSHPTPRRVVSALGGSRRCAGALCRAGLCSAPQGRWGIGEMRDVGAPALPGSPPRAGAGPARSPPLPPHQAPHTRGRQQAPGRVPAHPASTRRSEFRSMAPAGSARGAAGGAHCSSSQEGFSAPGVFSLMLNCLRVCSSCCWLPAK